jgi:hypothetical protein
LGPHYQSCCILASYCSTLPFTYRDDILPISLSIRPNENIIINNIPEERGGSEGGGGPESRNNFPEYSKKRRTPQVEEVKAIHSQGTADLHNSS